MKYNQFFAAFAASQAAGNPLSREEQISEFTGGRTTSLKELSVGELGELTRRLNSMSGFSVKNPHHGDKADKMRKSIIAIFHKMKRPPAAAIAWAEKQGVKGIKKPFNEYSTGELFVLIRVAEKALADYQLAIRKSIAP